MELVFIVAAAVLVWVAWRFYENLDVRWFTGETPEPPQDETVGVLRSAALPLDANLYPPCEGLDLVPPKQYNRAYRVWPTQNLGGAYRVNPYKMTCSCAEFKTRGSRFARGDIRRLCTHQAELLIDISGISGTPLECLLRERREVKCYHYPSPEVIFGFTPGYMWIDVYAGAKEQHGESTVYDRYVFNLVERRWAFNNRPPGSKELEAMIDQAFPIAKSPSSEEQPGETPHVKDKHGRALEANVANSPPFTANQAH